MRDVSIMVQDNPQTWVPLDWSTAIRKVSVMSDWEGCPIQLDVGDHFLGSG